MTITKEELKKRKINNIKSEKKLCIWCQGPLKERQMFYCSRKCQSHGHYITFKEKYIATARRWAKENPEKAYEKKKKSLQAFRERSPERFNELMMKNYRNNRNKWNSRKQTGRFLKGSRGYKKTEVILDKKCKLCNSIENLEIHHEIYPTKKKEIEQAMINGQIYYLCRKCHGGIHTHE